MTSELTVAREGSCARLTLNRPDRANALNPALTEALIDALQTAVGDGARLVVIEGTGKSLCSGFDLSDFDSLSDGDLVLRLLRIEILLQTLHHMPLPTLALAQGRIFGAGADLFCACSRRVAAPDAKFRMPGLAFGVVLGARRLALRVGQDAARDIQNASRTFDATEADRVNFATEIADQAEWPEIVSQATQQSEVIGAGATAALFRATATDTRSVDMADLVHSASVPGLSDRIRAYREEMKRASGKK